MSTRKYTVGSLKNATDEQYDAILKTVPKSENPTALSDFNYKYDDQGVLRNIDTGATFAWLNQKHYDALGDIIVPHIQNIMKTKYGLQEVWLPLGAAPDAPRLNIFMTPDVSTNQDKLMLLIQGAGAVRAGQWARALCINEGLKTGSILEYLERAIKEGYAVIVFNPNFNSVPVPQPAEPKAPVTDILDFWLGIDDKTYKEQQRRNSLKGTIPIPHNESPENHTVYVYDNFVKNAPAKNAVIVAHSYGGCCTVHLLRQRGAELQPRLKAIAFTDAVHGVANNESALVTTTLNNIATNWITSDKPLDTPERTRAATPCVSAGHTKHENTSASCYPSVFKFLEAKVSQT